MLYYSSTLYAIMPPLVLVELQYPSEVVAVQFPLAVADADLKSADKHKHRDTLPC
jgi:hypothetical protein